MTKEEEKLKMFFDVAKTEFSKQFDEAESDVEAMKLRNIEIPGYVIEQLNRMDSLSREADKEFEKGDIEEALKKMLEPYSLVRDVSYNVKNFYFMELFKEVRNAYKFFEGDEDIAALRVPNYEDHTKKISKIKETVRALESSGKKLKWNLLVKYIGQLLAFLDDFEASKKALSAATCRERLANRFKSIHIIATVVAAILGGAVVWFFGK